MEPNASQSAAALERYRVVRGQIEFEDGLITQRLNWFVAAQSFLFTAYAITLNSPPANQSASPGMADQHGLLFHLIPLVAISACALIYCTVLAGVVAQAHLRRFMQPFDSDPALANYPPLQGSRHTRVLGMSAPMGLPIVFAGVWAYLFIRGFS